MKKKFYAEMLNLDNAVMVNVLLDTLGPLCF